MKTKRLIEILKSHEKLNPDSDVLISIQDEGLHLACGEEINEILTYVYPGLLILNHVPGYEQ